MGKKNRSKKRTDPGNAAEFSANPFADLKIDLPDNDPHDTPAPPPQDEPDDGAADLSPEDRELLDAFESSPAADLDGLEPVRRRPLRRVHFNIERKGRRGKTVTKIAPFGHLGMVEQMELLKHVRRELGVGGTLDDDVMELQGDQRRRAAKWFAAQGYAVPPKLMD